MRRYGTGSVLPAATTGAYEGSGGKQVTGVEAYAYLEDITMTALEISPGMVVVVSSLE